MTGNEVRLLRPSRRVLAVLAEYDLSKFLRMVNRQGIGWLSLARRVTRVISLIPLGTRTSLELSTKLSSGIPHSSIMGCSGNGARQ
jgi:hypothetical protein